jgi:cyclopropane fatty-acyl-phospholipid synthase-like methyltransferase
MNVNPIELMFAGMEKLGPGGDVHTLNVLRQLPTQQFLVIVDAGCGRGRQAIVLARELATLVHAVDSYQPFLSDLTQRAAKAGLERLIETHCISMQDIPAVFPHIDLLWSEGAAYNIGFPNALKTWASAINEGGFAVVSELSWVREEIPDAVREFFSYGYPDMRFVEQTLEVADNSGYRVLSTYTLPDDTWVAGYYDILEPRAKTLMEHPDSSVREFAVETIREIEVFRCSEGSYAYLFYVLQRA